MTPEATPTEIPEPMPTQEPMLTPGPVTSAKGITAKPKLGSKKVELSWEAVPNVDGYIVYLKDDSTGKFKRLRALRDPNITTFNAKVDKFGETYTFKIQSFTKLNSGSSVYEDMGEVSVKLYEYDKSQKPNLRGTTKTGSKQISFQWDKVNGANGYMLYKYNSATKKYELLERIIGGDNIHYKFSNGLENGKTYAFRIRTYAETEDGTIHVNGKISKAVKVTTPPKKAKKPKVVSNTKNKVKISWQKVSRAKGYRVYRSTSPNGKYKAVGTISGGNKLNFTDNGLSSGQIYYYKIRAYSMNPEGVRSFGKISAAKKVKVK